ncbi:hypothetical protein M405DRAFT_835075 [Rhizopogon salebrosus TDB-379]|nr:hypothetical protein M405DRAFT_835075 [Rhizopogon salebrosus TDB-379]
MSMYFYSSGAITWLTLMQQKVFWGDDTTSIHRRLAPRTGPSPPHRHNFFDLLHFRQPVDGSPSIPLYARRWNVSSPTRRVSTHTVDVTPARDEDVDHSDETSCRMAVLACCSGRLLA